MNIVYHAEIYIFSVFVQVVVLLTLFGKLLVWISTGTQSILSCLSVMSFSLGK